MARLFPYGIFSNLLVYVQKMKYNCNNFCVYTCYTRVVEINLINKDSGGFSMIVMKNVYKKYPNGVVASNGINIEIDRGEFVFVVGPSGAGKSTFIKMMYREEIPTSGDIIIEWYQSCNIENKNVP